MKNKIKKSIPTLGTLLTNYSFMILVLGFLRFFCSFLLTALSAWYTAQTMDIADMAIQVGGAREGQSFVLKI
jgi:hypothetical protein